MQINKITYSNIKAILPYLGFALIVLSVKFIIIANYGNATPYWDQWNAEANNLYRPLLEGNLTWANMLAAHNNHRILTTRLLNITLFYINGRVWNPILQMQVNTVIHVFSLIILIFYVAKTLTPIYRNALLLFCTVIFSIPFGWQNVLEGFQSQFYFLLLFNVIFLWAMANYKTYSVKWWLGTIAGVLSFLSFASGAITLVVGAITSIFRRYINKEKDHIKISAIFTLMIIATIAIVLTPITLPQLKAKSITQFLFVFANIYSWPVYSTIMGIIITQTPILFLIFNIINKKEYQTVTLLFLMSIALWLFGQFTIIAYGRAVGFEASRYTDLFAVGLVINFSAIAILLDKGHFKKKLVYRVFGILWVVIILISFIQSKNTLSRNIINKSIRSKAEEQHIRAYLCSGNFSYLKNKRIPYPDVILLKKFLDNATIRSFLPGNIYGPNSNNPKTFCNEYANEKPLHSLNITVAKTCIGNIDRINDKALPKQFSIFGTLNISGWLAQSPMKVLPAAKSPIMILTDSKGKNLLFKTQKHHRLDVATHYKNPALSATGFGTTIDVSLMAGNYTLGLGFVEGENINICPQFKIPGTIAKK